MAGSGMYAYDPQRGTFGGGSLAPGTGKGPVVEARYKKKQEEIRKKAEAEAKEKAEAEPAPDPVATLPEAAFGLPVGSPEGADEGSGEGGAPEPEPEPEPAQPTGPVSLAGGLAVGSGAPNVDMGKLAKSRGGLPYSFEETEQDPVTVKFPMSQDQFDALSTREQMQAEQKLNQMGADRSKMILPTQADVNLYQSREGRLLEDGAPEPTFEIEADPRNYVDSRRPNEGRWIDPQTGDQYNVTEHYGRQLRQRMPQLVRPEAMDRMMGMGMAPEFMGAGKGPDLDKFAAKRKALREKFKPKKGVNREEGLAQLDEEAREETRQDRERATRGIDPEAVEAGLRYVETGDEDSEKPLSEKSKRDIAEGKIPLPPARFFEEREAAEIGAVDPTADLPDGSFYGEAGGSDFDRPEAQGATPEVDIPIDDDGEPDEGFDVQMDPEDVAAFREASENPLDPETAAYAALAEEDPELTASFEDAVETALAQQPIVTPELSDAELGPFIEAIFGKGTEATEERIAQVREILGKEAYRGMTPAQVSQRWNQFRDPLQ